MSVDVRAVLRETGAWIEGHFLLHSGRHSDQFIQMAQAFQYPDKVEMLCGALAEELKRYKPKVIIGPAVGGILMAHEVGRALGVRALYSEKRDGVHQLGRGFRIEPGEPVAVVDDVSTTGGSIREVMQAVRKVGGRVVAVGLLVDRSGGVFGFDVSYVWLASIKMESWQPIDCPLCRQGVPLTDPDTRQPIEQA